MEKGGGWSWQRAGLGPQPGESRGNRSWGSGGRRCTSGLLQKCRELGVCMGHGEPTPSAGEDSVHGPPSSIRTGLEVTPGPGAYSPEKAAPMHQRTPPAFTLGSRLRPRPLDTSIPAPNAYTLPPLWGSQVFIKPSSPSYTVLGRTPPARPLQDPAELPGPGQYDSPDPNAYRQRPPSFTLLGRPRAPRPRNETPGPGTHSPEGVTVTKARAPAFSMGIRHSKRATTMAADSSRQGLGRASVFPH